VRSKSRVAPFYRTRCIFSSDCEHWHVALTFKLKLDSVKGYWTTRGYANLRIANARTGYLADWSTRGLDNWQTSQHADWTSRGLNNSRIPTMWTYRIISLICLSTHAKNINKWLNNNIQLHFIMKHFSMTQWRVLCPHNHLFKTTTTTSNIRELSSYRVKMN